MKWTILGSGGCQVIPKPLCDCRVCVEARNKGVPYARSGPSAYLHDIGLLIDTPTEVVAQLNHCDIKRVDTLMFTHLDPDHAEGFRVVEQIALDFRTWSAYPEKQIRLLVPEPINGLEAHVGHANEIGVRVGKGHSELAGMGLEDGPVLLLEEGSRALNQTTVHGKPSL